ncbi:hypothetical protein F2P81_013284 [Scophthalmus maximus]|uniref:Major facilitator superfamily (MFS) profile domain-containing protein n=1 Tax=Scophthalmus maximus TaxID=52904 RepID=A0A6A4SJX3_SCOMX|nr:hypothetical protein F2P81_013284 [Scophthalmus maximus]
MGGCLIDRHCRRNTILLSNILLLTGTLVLLISSYSALVLGRITVGFAMCISSMSCCIFVSEVVTPDRRGFMVILYEAGITVGILFAYAINYILSDSRSGWKWMFGLAIVPILVQLVSVLFLPSSTRAEADLMSPTETQQADDKQKCDSMYLFHRKDNMRTRTVIGLGLVLFQQFTGQPNILFYASTIFDSVGFQSGDSAVLASAGLGLVKVIATLTSMVLSDRVGRRPMLISGCSVMALCLITIGLLSGHSPMNTKRPCHLDFNVNTTDLPTSPADGRSDVDMPLDESHGRLYNNTEDENLVFDKVGLKTLEPASESPSSVSGSFVSWIILMLTWLLLSEIFPAAVRGRAFAFINCFNWAANLLVTFTFLNVVDAIGLSKMFVLYGITAVAAAVFVYLVLPETKGMTLEAIDEELRLSSKVCDPYAVEESPPPLHTQWIKDVLYIMKLEKIKHFLRGSTSTFSKTWLPFLEHVRSLQLDIGPSDAHYQKLIGCYFLVLVRQPAPPCADVGVQQGPDRDEHEGTTAGPLDQQHVLERLQQLEQEVVGGEQARNQELQQRDRQRKNLADQRKVQLIHALSENSTESENVLLNLKAPRLEISDLQAEFEVERNDYLASIRRIENDNQLQNSLLERMGPLVRRDCNYSNFDRLKREAAWDEEAAGSHGAENHATIHSPPLVNGAAHLSMSSSAVDPPISSDSVLPRPFRLESLGVPVSSGKVKRKKSKSHIHNEAM